MNRFFKSLVTLAALVSTVAAQAQFDFPLTQPRFILITNPLVREHLKLTEDQKKRVDSALESVVQKDGEKITIMIGPDTDAEELDKVVKAALDDKQRDRFEQLWLQSNGMLSLSEDKTGKAFSLTDDQKKKLNGIFEDYREKMKDLFMSSSGGGTEISIDHKKMEELKKEVEVKVTEVLTDEQRKKWKDMTGEKFDFEKKKNGTGF